jgi:hypothetical protein
MLAAGLLLLSWFGWLRVQQSLSGWQFIQSLEAPPGPLYLALSGALWGLAGLAGAILLWLGWRWSPRLTRAMALFFAISYWADRLGFDRNPSSRVNWPFTLIFNLFLLAAAWCTFYLPAVKSWLKKGER